MPFIDVRIKWDEPDEKFWMNPDNLKLCLREKCPNTNFEIVYLSRPNNNNDDEMINDLHKLAMEEITPTWVKNGDSG